MLEKYKDKRVLITGHTGFKGAWLCEILKIAGAEVVGYALEPEGQSLFRVGNMGKGMESVIGDIRDLESLHRVMEKYQPEVVFHLAAQPLVRKSYECPVETYETNIMGTVHLLECARKCNSVKSVLNVTTDKVYENKEWVWGYRENDTLNGFDPYSNSKSCSELVTDSYKKCFLNPCGIKVSTARAGNVIGGGDFAKDRIIPDCVRAAAGGEEIVVRNPYSIRPFQHVLEPLFAYLLIAERQIAVPELQGSYNIGPDEGDCCQVGELVEEFCTDWGEGLQWKAGQGQGAHEAKYLKLDNSKMKDTFGWEPILTIKEAIAKTVEWSKCFLAGKDVKEVMDRQILGYAGQWKEKGIAQNKG